MTAPVDVNVSSRSYTAVSKSRAAVTVLVMVTVIVPKAPPNAIDIPGDVPVEDNIVVVDATVSLTCMAAVYPVLDITTLALFFHVKVLEKVAPCSIVMSYFPAAILLTLCSKFE